MLREQAPAAPYNDWSNIRHLRKFVVPLEDLNITVEDKDLDVAALLHTCQDSRLITLEVFKKVQVARINPSAQRDYSLINLRDARAY